ncbi:MAG: hypothetical protein M3N08_07845 [Pseudomonadota bacterium]|nr:hypothetical protein [Pseudomonadota bacterium]
MSKRQFQEASIIATLLLGANVLFPGRITSDEIPPTILPPPPVANCLPFVPDLKNYPAGPKKPVIERVTLIDPFTALQPLRPCAPGAAMGPRPMVYGRV